MLHDAITDVPGIQVGQGTDDVGLTGCTVILPEQRAVCAVSVVGGAPDTKSTEQGRPGFMLERADAVVLSGGSAFGLEACFGVMQHLEEQGRGLAVGAGVVPVVPGAVVFDLGLGSPAARPDKAMGYAACAAARGGPVPQGNVGVGTGCTVGKLFGRHRAMKGGLGTASAELPGGIVVGAIVAVNALGSIFDRQAGRFIAGARGGDDRLVAVEAELLAGALPGGFGRPGHLAGENTTIGCVATNAGLTKEQAWKVAQMAHAGLCRAIVPVHTPSDGDTVFVLDTWPAGMPAEVASGSDGTDSAAASAPGSGPSGADVMQIGSVAAWVLERAVVRGVQAARSAAGIPGLAG